MFLSQPRLGMIGLPGAGASWRTPPFAIRLWSTRANHWSECSPFGTIDASFERSFGGACRLFSGASKTCGQLDIDNGKIRVKLVMAGCGYLGPTDAMVRDGNLGPDSHVIAAGRKSTTAFGDARQEDIPESVDKKHLKNIKRWNELMDVRQTYQGVRWFGL